MYMINGSQIRAARGFLNWTQSKLADIANISRGTIQMIESDQPVRLINIQKIETTFKEHGVEFLGTNGVTLRENKSEGFSGPESCDQFFDHALKALKTFGGDFICMIRDQDMLTRLSGSQHFTNLQRLEEVSKIAHIKCLITDKIKLTSLPSFEVRVIEDEPIFMNSSFFAFGEELVCGFADSKQPHLSFVAIYDKLSIHSCQNYFLPRWHMAKKLLA